MTQTRGDTQSVNVGLLAPPQLRPTVVEDLVDDLIGVLRKRTGGTVAWQVHAVRDNRAPDASPDSDEFSIAPDGTGMDDVLAQLRQVKEAQGWDVLIALTDMPLRSHRRPVVAHVSVHSDVAVFSIPAVGALRRAHRECCALAALVETMRSDDVQRLRVAGVGRLVPGDPSTRQPMQILAPAGLGHLRVITGMVRADRPWRLVVKLSYMLAAAVATAAVTLVTSDIWMISNALGFVRLPLLTLISVATLVIWLIIVHDLWERPSQRGGREQAVLFNVVTVASLGLAVLLLYVALFVITLLGGLFLIDRAILESELGHPASLGAYVRLAWMAASLATVAGAIGSGLEGAVDIREAAYSYHPERQQNPDDPPGGPGRA